MTEETLESIRHPPNPESAPPPTITEVTTAVQRFKRGRVVDVEGLSAELLQAAVVRATLRSMIYLT